MLNKIILENFKGYSFLELDKLKRVNLIAGMNNTGKTSILEAIYMQHDRLAGDLFIAPLVRRGAQQFDLSVEYIFHPYFNDFNFHNPFKIITEDSGYKTIATYSMVSPINQKVEINKNDLFMNSVLSSSMNINNVMEIAYACNNKPQGKSRIQIVNNQIEMNVENMMQANRQVVFVPASARGNSVTDAQFMSKLDLANGIEEFISYLKMIDSRLKNVSLLSIGGMPTIYVDVGLKRKIPMIQMGEGISKLTSILTAILSNQNAIILIDEIENGIHYSLMPKIWEILFAAAQKQKCQIFATTHSHDVIEGVAKYMNKCSESKSDIEQQSFSYIRLDRDKEGLVVPKYYGPSTLLASVERDWDIR
ncbi:AAA family ATPase [Enterobacter mori]|uniref:AAA family ATPase n=1 Tax=Enterobacter mori TaxID=539813 RepID=UPI0028AC6631|nr:AAA family ATPase [Enterobacter mori]HED2467881.1 AAA family ATPase [Enterobacter mori]